MDAFKGLKGGSGGSSRKTRQYPDDLFTTDIVEVVLGISEGPIVGLEDGATKFYAGDTPLIDGATSNNNIGNFSLTIANGVNPADPIVPKLGGFGTSTSVGVALTTPGTYVTRSGTQNNIDYLEVRLTISRLVQTNSEGGQFPTTFDGLIEIKPQSSGTWVSAFDNDLPPPTVTTSSYTTFNSTTAGKGYVSNPAYREVFIQAAAPVSVSTANAIWFESDVTNYPPRVWNGSAFAAPSGLTSVTIGGLPGWTWTESGVVKQSVYSATGVAPTGGMNQYDIMVTPTGVLGNVAPVAYTYNGTSYVNYMTWGQPQAAVDGQVKITGKTSSVAVKEIRIPVDRINEPYDIRIKRTSIANTTEYFADVSWESFQELSVTPLVFDDLATAHLTVVSSDQFSSVPQWTGVYKGRILQVPTNYNESTKQFDGVWDGLFKLAWTDNGAWVVYDLIKNTRYGVSAYRSMEIDKYAVYEFGKHWRARNFSYNEYITEPRPIDEAINHICAIAGGRYVDRGDGYATILFDADDQPAVALFSPENVVDGIFTYSYTDVGSRKNDFLVAYVDPEIGWKENRVRVFDQDHIDKYGRNVESFIAPGCIDKTEAIRRGRVRLATALYEKEIVTFKTNRYGKYLDVYDVILVADEDMDDVITGRVKSFVDSFTLQLRDAVVLEVGVTYTLRVTVPTSTGYQILERTVSTPAGSTTTLTVTQSFDPYVITNYHPYTNMAGAVVGSPGTLPTGWAMNVPTGLSHQVVAIGTNYVDIRVSGTSSAVATIRFLSMNSTQLDAATGQVWTFSTYIKLLSASGVALNNCRAIVYERDSGGTVIGTTNGTSQLSTFLTGVDTRISATDTMNQVGVAKVNGAFDIGTVNIGDTLDVTVRIWGLQMERTSAPSTVINTDYTVVNQHPNSTFAGASVGTPGTYPTNWLVQHPTGLSEQILAVGSGYVDVRLSGTAGTTATIRFNTMNGVFAPTVIGDVWTYSAKVRLLSATGVALNNCRGIMYERDSGGTTLSTVNGASQLTNFLAGEEVTVSATDTMNQATVTQVNGAFDLGTVTSGDTIDITVRIHSAQLRKTPSAVTNLLITTGTSPVTYSELDKAVFSLGGPKAFRITSIDEAGGNPDQIDITAVEVNRTKWAFVDSVVSPPTTVVTGLPSRFVQPVTNVQITPTSGGALLLTWDKSVSDFIRGYRVYYNTDRVADVLLGEPSVTQFLVTDLTPATYNFSVVAVNVNNDESPPAIVEYQIVGNFRPVAPPSGLAVSWTAQDAVLTWTASTDLFVNSYRVEVRDSGSNALFSTHTVTSPTFTYTYNQNTVDGGPRRSVKFVVWAVTQDNVTSPSINLTVSNAAPAAITPVVSTSLLTATVTYTRPADADFAGVLLYRSTTPGFTPGGGNLIYDGPQNEITMPDLTPGNYYIKMQPYDAFGKVALNTSTEVGFSISAVVIDALGTAQLIDTPKAMSAEALRTLILEKLQRAKKDGEDQASVGALAGKVVQTASRTEEVRSQIEGNLAVVKEEVVTAASSILSVASRVTTIEAEVDDVSTGLNAAHSRITTEQVARADGDSAIASSVTALGVTVNSQIGQAASAENKLTNIVAAGQSVDLINTIKAALSRASGDRLNTQQVNQYVGQLVSLSQQIVTLNSQVQANIASFNEVTTTIAAEQFSQASQITSVQAQTNYGTANGKIQFIATSAPGGVDARYQIQVETTTPGVYAAAGLYLDVVGGTSKITMSADKIIMAVAGGTDVAPFEVATIGGTPALRVTTQYIKTLLRSDVYTEAADGTPTAGWKLTSDGILRAKGGILREADISMADVKTLGVANPMIVAGVAAEERIAYVNYNATPSGYGATLQIIGFVRMSPRLISAQMGCKKGGNAGVRDFVRTRSESSTLFSRVEFDVEGASNDTVLFNADGTGIVRTRAAGGTITDRSLGQVFNPLILNPAMLEIAANQELICLPTDEGIPLPGWHSVLAGGGTYTDNTLAGLGTYPVVVPAGMLYMDVLGAWGGGGAGGGPGFVGGPGEYRVGKFAVTPGETLWIVIGQGGLAATIGGAPAVGFGGRSYGATTDYFHGGGGLTGVFRGPPAQGNALLIAGGGGAGHSAAHGGVGGHASEAGSNGRSGSVEVMRGIDGAQTNATVTVAGSAGGGGYVGGGNYGSTTAAGRGGTGYLIAGATGGSNTVGTRGSTTAPNEASSYWRTPYGRGGAAQAAGQSGMIAFKWTTS